MNTNVYAILENTNNSFVFGSGIRYKKISLKAETQNITSPALMSSSVKVVFHQGHLPLQNGLLCVPRMFLT